MGLTSFSISASLFTGSSGNSTASGCCGIKVSGVGIFDRLSLIFLLSASEILSVCFTIFVTALVFASENQTAKDA